MCNLLTTILTPNFEDPLETAQQLVDNDITIFSGPGTDLWKQFLADSPISEYNKLAETFYIPQDWYEFDDYCEQYIIGEGTHATMGNFLTPEMLDMGRWWQSKENLIGVYPFGGYISTKKWHLNEVSI